MYSATYFGELTFKQATALDFPTIYEPNSISAWTFTDEITSLRPEIPRHVPLLVLYRKLGRQAES